jgi:hypothetical protein
LSAIEVDKITDFVNVFAEEDLLLVALFNFYDWTGESSYLPCQEKAGYGFLA